MRAATGRVRDLSSGGTSVCRSAQGRSQWALSHVQWSFLRFIAVEGLLRLLAAIEERNALLSLAAAQTDDAAEHWEDLT